MMKNKLINDYVPRAHNVIKKKKMPSKMIPNQAFTVKKILEMAKQGVTLGQMREAVYDGQEFPDGNPMRKQNFDLSDIDVLKEEIEKAKDFEAKAKKIVEKAEKAKEKAKEKDALRKEIEEEERLKQKTKQKE